VIHDRIVMLRLFSLGPKRSVISRLYGMTWMEFDLERIKGPALVSLGVCFAVYWWMASQQAEEKAEEKAEAKVEHKKGTKSKTEDDDMANSAADSWLPIVAGLVTFMVLWYLHSCSDGVKPGGENGVVRTNNNNNNMVAMPAPRSLIGGGGLSLDKLNKPLLSEGFANRKYAVRNNPIKLPSNDVFIDLAKF
jgi:hypothetical protein